MICWRRWARELVEQGGVGHSADAVWDELRRERASQAGAAAQLPKPESWEEVPMIEDMFSGIATPVPTAASRPVLVESKPKQKELESIWPTGYVVGEQMRLFG
jgi:hypothetical protein